MGFSQSGEGRPRRLAPFIQYLELPAICFLLMANCSMRIGMRISKRPAAMKQNFMSTLKTTRWRGIIPMKAVGMRVLLTFRRHLSNPLGLTSN